MADVRGTFTVWCLPRVNQPNAPEHHAQGIKANSKLDLMKKAQEACPAGSYVKAIYWQYGGTTTVWFKVDGRTAAQCWDTKACARIFGS